MSFFQGRLSEGTKILYEYLNTPPKKLMILGPFNDDLAKTVAAYAGLPEIGILQVRINPIHLVTWVHRHLNWLWVRNNARQENRKLLTLLMCYHGLEWPYHRTFPLATEDEQIMFQREISSPWSSIEPWKKKLRGLTPKTLNA